MAPSLRAKRQGGIASAPQPSGAAAPPPSNIKNPNIDQGSKNTGYEPNGTISYLDQPSKVLSPVPQIYDLDTYDPERQMQWTPEPEPYDPETYAAWGLKYFGNDWYEQRRIMLQERNIYFHDPVYKSRQKALRVMERKIEGRPLEPRDGLLDQGWQRLWARLSEALPWVETAGTPAAFQPNDSDSNVSGYSTYPPTPEPRELTPPPNDPWELLELHRKTFNWDEERYQFERIFLKESLIDKARNGREDEEGDRRRKEEQEKIGEVQYIPGTAVTTYEYEKRMRKFNRQCWGWTQEEAETADQAETAKMKWLRKNPPPLLSTEGSDAYKAWQQKNKAWQQKKRTAYFRIYGGHQPESSDHAVNDTWLRNIQTRLSSQREQEPGAEDTTECSRSPSVGVNEAHLAHLTPYELSILRTYEASIANRQSERARASEMEDMPNESNAQVPQKTRKRQPKVHNKEACDTVQGINDRGLQSKPHSTRQRKVYNQERVSRRLAGHLPEYGMLPKRGEPAPPYEPPSNTRKPNPSGPHNRASSKKKSIAVKGAKPRGISKSGDEGRKRPKISRK